MKSVEQILQDYNREAQKQRDGKIKCETMLEGLAIQRQEALAECAELEITDDKLPEIIEETEAKLTHILRQVGEYLKITPKVQIDNDDVAF